MFRDTPVFLLNLSPLTPDANVLSYRGSCSEKVGPWLMHSLQTGPPHVTSFGHCWTSVSHLGLLPPSSQPSPLSQSPPGIHKCLALPPSWGVPHCSSQVSPGEAPAVWGEAEQDSPLCTEAPTGCRSLGPGRVGAHGRLRAAGQWGWILEPQC